ncbi:hypothetical protein ACG83_03105 [Frankia sp. R43]|uniref:hypothetical protein n=1 Tax=Frankia sp. R43 TaxID=269536 RepID=UPI0006CA1692|nr:hypothetical protein [Frankia sp. R43]KPM56852.1 hypothetical protein ACG83_03105 [Frankia sp. R43]
MTTDEQIAGHLRDLAQAVTVAPSGDLWPAVRGRLPRERFRRVARWAAPAVACAVAVAAVAAGLTLGGGQSRASITPADLQGSPAVTRLQSMTFTDAEETRVVSACRQTYSSTEGQPAPRVEDLRVWAGARDSLGASIVLTDGSMFVECDVPADSSGGLFYGLAGLFDQTAEPKIVSPDLTLTSFLSTHPVGGGLTADGLENNSQVSVSVAQVSARVSRVTATVSDRVIEVPVKDGRAVIRVSAEMPPALKELEDKVVWPEPELEAGAEPDEAELSAQYDTPEMKAWEKSWEGWIIGNLAVIRAYDSDGRVLGTWDEHSQLGPEISPAPS